MFCLKNESNYKNDTRYSSYCTITAIAVIAVIGIMLFALVGCGCDGSISDSSTNESAQSSESESIVSSTRYSVKPSVNDYTWDELSRISEEISEEINEENAIAVAKEYNLVNSDGELDGTQIKEIQLADGRSAAVQITGFLHDNKTDGGKAGITFIFQDPVAIQSMNSSETNAGGWESSQLRSWLATDGLAMLPQDLSNRIVAVDKMTNNVGEIQLAVDGERHDYVSSVTATSDKLWLFSAKELCGQVHWYSMDSYNRVLDAEGSEYKLFKDCDVDPYNPNSILTKKLEGCYGWWERSPNPGRSAFFFNVSVDSEDPFVNSTSSDYEGIPNQEDLVTNSSGVVPGFCI